MSEFSVAAVFSDRMVLQRGKNIKIFGTCSEGDKISVSFCGTTVTADINNGKWQATLPPFDARRHCTLTVVCGEQSLEFTDVAVGEVWLAGGQSNMELELQNCLEWPQIKELPADDDLRFYYTQKKAYLDDEFYISEAQTHWTAAGSDDMRFWSAVGYFFGAKLRTELDVPVGIIGCNWGGTSASAWIDRDALSTDNNLNSYIIDYLNAVGDKTVDEQLAEFKEYTEYHKQFEKRMAELYTEQPDIEWDDALAIVGECRWPGPMNCANPYRPSGLYECMISRIAPYSLRGFIYYQGESDEHKPTIYYKLLSTLIGCWRRYWEDDSLPFICVQLPMHRYKGEPDRKHWPLIREAQMRVFNTVKNTGIAVAIDQGEWNEIHPKAKSIVGQRLALQALLSVYNLTSPENAFGPIFRSCEPSGCNLRLHFDYAENGFTCKADSLQGFEIAGADGKYIAANAIIDGNTIILSSDEIDTPRFARYLWTNYSEVTLFGKNGIPLAPFRSSLSDNSESELDLSGK